MTPSSVKHTSYKGNQVSSSGKKSSGLGYISEDEAQQEEDESAVVIDEEEDESGSEAESEHPAAFSEIKEPSVKSERSVSSDKHVATPVLKMTSPVLKSKPSTAKKASVTKTIAKPSAKKSVTK